MASAIFRMGTSSVIGGPYTYGSYDVSLRTATKYYYVKVELQSTAGVNSIAVTIPTADEATLLAGAPAVTVDQATKTAIFRLANTAFRSYNVNVTVNGGLTNGVADANLTRELQVCVPDDSGLTAFVVGESDQYHRTYGHTEKHNALARGVMNATWWKYYYGTVATTDATVTDIITIPAPSSSGTYHFEAHVIGFKNDAPPAGNAYIRSATYRWNSALGSWTLAAATSIATEDEAGAWGVGFAIHGTAIDLQVTGAAATNITWVADIQRRKVSA